jgi:hypothetical protein
MRARLNGLLAADGAQPLDTEDGDEDEGPNGDAGGAPSASAQ